MTDQTSITEKTIHLSCEEGRGCYCDPETKLAALLNLSSKVEEVNCMDCLKSALRIHKFNSRLLPSNWDQGGRSKFKELKARLRMVDGSLERKQADALKVYAKAKRAVDLADSHIERWRRLRVNRSTVKERAKLALKKSLVPGSLCHHPSRAILVRVVKHGTDRLVVAFPDGKQWRVFYKSINLPTEIQDQLKK